MDATEKKWQAHIEHLETLVAQDKRKQPNKVSRFSRPLSQQKAALVSYRTHIK